MHIFLLRGLRDLAFAPDKAAIDANFRSALVYILAIICTVRARAFRSFRNLCDSAYCSVRN